MKVFVTGVDGFVGRALGWHLIDKEHEVIGLIRHIEWPFEERYILHFPKGRTTLVPGDIRDYQRMREILLKYKPDAIVHLAAQAITSQAFSDPLTTYDVNTGGTIALLSAWLRELPEAHFLYFSTDKVYRDGLNKAEDTPLAACGPYESSKAAADLITQNYLRAGYPVTITRSGNIYGPEDRNPRLIPTTIQRCLRGQAPIVYKTAGRWEYTYIDDTCRILAQLLERRMFGVWNISSGKVLLPSEVVAEILTHFPGIKPEYVDTPPWVSLKDQSLDTTKLCANLDCLSFVRFEEGIKRTVEWWKTQETKSPTAKQVTMTA